MDGTTVQRHAAGHCIVAVLSSGPRLRLDGILGPARVHRVQMEGSMRRRALFLLGILAVAGAWSAQAPATAQTPPAKMVIFEFFERIT